MAIVAIVLAVVLAVPVVLSIIGILAAIAIPNFIKFQARSKQAECKVNLTAFATASRIHFAAHGRYTPLLGELGFSPERGNRYAYFADRTGTLEARTAATAVPSALDTGMGVDLFKLREADAIDAYRPPGSCSESPR